MKNIVTKHYSNYDCHVYTFHVFAIYIYKIGLPLNELQHVTSVTLACDQCCGLLIEFPNEKY